MFDRRIGFLVLALAGCGESFVAGHSTGGAAGAGGCGGSTLSTSWIEGGNDHGGDGGGGEGGATSSLMTTSEVTSTGTGGAPSGFFAQCQGTVDCPDMASCADWEYSVEDDGTTTMITAKVTLADPSLSCSDQTQYATSEDDGLQVAGNIMFPCDLQTWAFGIDKATKLVYVKEMTQGYSWTPECQ